VQSEIIEVPFIIPIVDAPLQMAAHYGAEPVDPLIIDEAVGLLIDELSHVREIPRWLLYEMIFNETPQMNIWGAEDWDESIRPQCDCVAFYNYSESNGEPLHRMYFREYPCESNLPIAHEFAHYFLQMLEGNLDQNHELNDLVWKPGGIVWNAHRAFKIWAERRGVCDDG